MEQSIQAISRAVRRRLKRVVQKSRDKEHTRRAEAMLHLAEGCSVSAAARLVRAARSTVHDWKNRFEEYGEEGLAPYRRGRGRSTVSEALMETLEELVRLTPAERGYLSSRWTSELLARELQAQLGISIHASTVRRLLPVMGFGWRRARPTLCKRDPHRNRKLRAIDRLLKARRRGTEVFFADEADVHLNPRIGFAWMARGAQQAIPTPGQNEKRYIAGALHAHTGRVVCVEWESKDSLLFIRLLNALRRTYRAAKRIVLIVDNYRIHKSLITTRWLMNNPKIGLLFQPAYYPWVNRIERLWKQLHDTVTRNHRFSSLKQLMKAVWRFLEAVQPFPGNDHALAKMVV